MLALMGHMSRAMLERYSHIRMAATREAVSGVTLRQKIEKSEVVPVIVPVVARMPRFSDLQVIERSGERGGNRTFNLLIKSQRKPPNPKSLQLNH